MMPLYFLSEISKYCKKIFLKFWCRQPWLWENFEVSVSNCQIRITVLNYTEVRRHSRNLKNSSLKGQMLSSPSYIFTDLRPKHSEEYSKTELVFEKKNAYDISSLTLRETMKSKLSFL